jgi:nucleoside-diphosphate-sugar epimerase
MNGIECLVTGGSGFLGRYAVQSLVAAGNDVTVLGRAAFAGRRTIVADLTKPGLDLGRSPFFAIYHFAGLAHHAARTEAEQQRFFQVNSGGTKNLLSALEHSDKLPDAVVLISTVAVYGIEEGVQVDETTPRNALEPYGASKIQAENILLDWGARHGVRTAVIRLPLVVGRDAPGNLGALVGALKRGTYLGVGSGTARRSMVLASDVARVLPAVAKVGGIFHLTDGYHPSFVEIENALSAAIGRKAPKRLPKNLAGFSARVGDFMQQLTGVSLPLTTSRLTKMTSTLTFSDDLARKAFGWNPSRVLDYAAEIV